MTARRRLISSAGLPSLNPEAERSAWRGAVSWERRGDVSIPWRLDRSTGAPIDDALAEVAKAAAGVRAHLRTDSRAVRLALDHLDGEPGCIDVVVDGVRRERIRVQPGSQVLESALPGVTSEVELWLPQAGITAVRSLELVEASTASVPQAEITRWVTYGSSITQCYEAPGPTSTWPALAARRLGWDLTCLGFSGHCLLDEVAAATIAGLSADVVSLCVGINVYNRGDWTVDEFAERLRRFLRKVRSESSEALLVVISPIVSPSRETAVNGAGATLASFRERIATVAEEADAEGARAVRYVDGLDLLGADDAGMLPDGLHPDGDGYALIADRLVPILRAGLER